MNKVFSLALGGLLAGTLMSGCVPVSNDYDTLKAQVTQHDQILSQLNMQLSGVQPAQADTWSQVQSLRQEIASMRGDLDTINMALSQNGGAAGLADLLARHDRALRLIESQMAMDLQLDQSSVGMNAPIAGYAGQGQVQNQAYTQGSSIPVTVPATPIVTQNANLNSDTAQALYDAGIASFNNRRYEQALKSFSDFTDTYNSHSLTANAWFWQGESHYQLKNYGAAALSYEKVISEFPNSNKTPDSYFKQVWPFCS